MQKTYLLATTWLGILIYYTISAVFLWPPVSEDRKFALVCIGLILAFVFFLHAVKVARNME